MNKIGSTCAIKVDCYSEEEYTYIKINHTKMCEKCLRRYIAGMAIASQEIIKALGKQTRH